MPAGQAEAVLLHEPAHIRRRGCLVPLVRAITEDLIFYHPRCDGFRALPTPNRDTAAATRRRPSLAITAIPLPL